MKIVVADDHALFRAGIRHVLRGLETGVEVLEAANGRTALAFAAEDPDIDVVLLDLHMPNMDGLSALAQFAERYPTLPVVMLSASTSRNDMQRALDLGAMGYIPKDSTGPVMLNALRLILSGGIYIPPELARASLAAGINTSAAVTLTPRQQDVMILLVQGKTNKQIAEQLDLAEATVKMHITAIMKVLDVTNRTQAVVEARRLGLIQPQHSA